ncbi:hypothetical protein PCANC_18375 [Puccinia coronata f. sp. avenae]|nr:hypothetical protein PCANC_19998 [Puccinia coronata f. sp. avenae]PLW43805.1 hypothetical protein PCANC_18375 [Puccinia coronata f. sp. avenae]
MDYGGYPVDHNHPGHSYNTGIPWSSHPDNPNILPDPGYKPLAWSKRRLTNSGQAVPAGRAGGPAQPVILLTGQTGLFDQCASQAGLHDR